MSDIPKWHPDREYPTSNIEMLAMIEEIERLNAEIARQRKQFADLLFGRIADHQLITQLADALSRFHPTSVEYNLLLQQAREATNTDKK